MTEVYGNNIQGCFTFSDSMFAKPHGPGESEKRSSQYCKKQKMWEKYIMSSKINTLIDKN